MPSSSSSVAQLLPPDIICEILKHFPADSFVIGTKSGVKFPFHLGQICTSWRDAFHSIPEFWSTLTLRYPRDFQSQDAKHVGAMTRIFLEKGLPFSFQIDYQYTISKSSNVLAMLIADSTRWKKATIALKIRQIPMLLDIKDRLPLLTSLTLHVGGYALRRNIAAAPKGCEGIFENAPSLTRVRLYTLQALRFKWSSLTTLRLDYEANGDWLLQCLRQMTNLEELMVNDRLMYSSRPDKTSTVTLPLLKTLAISSAALLMCLQTPSLEYLSSGNTDYYEFAPRSICDGFFQRSNCRLRHLVIGTCTPDSIAHVLNYTPDLSSLELLHFDYVEDMEDRDCFEIVMACITCGFGNPALAPQLESLKIHSPHVTYDMTYEQMGIITAMVASRTVERPGYVHRLRHITLYNREHDRGSVPDLVKEINDVYDVQIVLEPLDIYSKTILHAFYEANFDSFRYKI